MASHAFNTTVYSPPKKKTRNERMLSRNASAVSPASKVRKPGKGKPIPLKKHSAKSQVAEGAALKEAGAALKEENPFVAQELFIEVKPIVCDDAPPSADTNRNVRIAGEDQCLLIVDNGDGTFACGICVDLKFINKNNASMHQRMFHPTSADSAFWRGGVGK